MKKLLLLSLTLISITALAGCKQRIEILEINEADEASVLKLLEAEGEEIPNPNY